MEVLNDNKCFIQERIENKEYLKSTVNLSKAIKSNYIFEYIFSFLCEKNKINMIIYNKKLQKKFNINIDNYKALSGKIYIGEKNGIGKEYILNTNRLIFEGEYLNGKKNGKGKEYFGDGTIKFEGEYLNGSKKNGRGYNYIGKLILEIDKNGKGKEYCGSWYNTI